MSLWQNFRRSWAEWSPRNYSTTHHLTPVGWYQGEDAPYDRVETWKALHELGPGNWRRITWWCVWVSPSVPLAERDALRAKYPPGGWLRYDPRSRCFVRVGEPLDRLPKEQPAEPTVGPWNAIGLRRALPIYWIVILVALAALAIFLAIPAMHDTPIERWVRGECTLRIHGSTRFQCEEDHLMRTRH